MIIVDLPHHDLDVTLAEAAKKSSNIGGLDIVFIILVDFLE